MTSAERSKPGASRATSGILLTLIAAMSFASAGFIASRLVDDATPGVTVGFFEAGFGLSFVIAVNGPLLRRTRRINRGAMLWIAGAGASFALAISAFYTALERIPFSVGAPITGAVPLVSYAFVFVLLRGQERITPRALVGAAMVVAGVGVVGATA